MLPNPTETIVRTHLATLSYWFEMNRDAWSQRLCDNNVHLIRSMQAYDAILYQNMTAISRWKEKTKKKAEGETKKKAEDDVENDSRKAEKEQDDKKAETGMGKFHSASHMSDLPMQLGNLKAVVCSTMESNHREMVTRLFKKTSTRYDSELQEMSARTREALVQDQDTFARVLADTDSIEGLRESLPKRFKYEIVPDNSEFKRARNARLKRWNGNSEGLGNYLHPIFVPDYVDHMNELFPIDHQHELNFSIITGVKYTGGKAALFNEGVIYCTPRLGGRNGTARYSPISFTNFDNTLRFGVVIGCTVVSSILPDVPTKTLFHVYILEIAGERVIPSFWPFLRFQYSHPLQLVTISSCRMVDHLFLYPDFIAPNSSLEASAMGETERFWLIDREFTDRFGSDDSKLYCNLDCGATVETARAYIRKKAAKGINIDIAGIPNHSTTPGAHTQFHDL